MPLNNLIRRTKLFRGVVAAYEAETVRVEHLKRENAEAGAMVESLADKLETAEESIQELNAALELERVKRVAAEQIAVSRGNEVDWLRENFNKALESRDAAQAQQFDSLNLVNTTLLHKAEAEAPPTREQLTQWKPVMGRNKQAVPALRNAQAGLIAGLQAKLKKKPAPPTPTEEKVS